MLFPSLQIRTESNVQNIKLPRKSLGALLTPKKYHCSIRTDPSPQPEVIMTAPAYKEPSDMTPEELIKRFESDIIYDCHSYTSRFGRSPGRKELERRGLSVLPQIIDHLRQNPPGDGMDLRTAWGNLLNNFAIHLGEDEVRRGPELLKDTAGWINWAVQVVSANPQ